MDLQSLTQLFATTYDSNPNNRKASELAIRKVRAFREADHVGVITTDPLSHQQLAGQEGVIPALLQIIASDNVDEDVNLLHVFDLVFAVDRLLHRFNCAFSSNSATRQAISVWIKNRVASSYGAEPARVGPDYKPISPADRAALKSNILLLLAGSPSRLITVQLASTLKTLISHDFPEKWPELLGGAKALLASSNIREVGAGTVVVLEMVRAFRYAPVSLPCCFLGC